MEKLDIKKLARGNQYFTMYMIPFRSYEPTGCQKNIRISGKR